MKVNREKLLNALELCAPGISERDIIEQSSCYLLKDGMIITYDDETACSYPSPLGTKITGAVQAGPLRAILAKLKESTILVEINKTKSELSIKGKGRRMGVTMAQTIELPIENLEIPKKWTKLPKQFAEGIAFVKDCAGRDDANFDLTCIHLHPKWVEAFDNYQFARFNLKMPIKRSVLVRQIAIKNILSLEMEEFSETENWIHFRNKDKLTLSCRRYMDEYRNLNNIAEHTGRKISLPKGLGEAASRAEVFSEHNPHENNVLVNLVNNWIKLKGEGQYGWYTERKKIAYTGPEMNFRIQPHMLMQLVKQHTECQVSDMALKAEIGGTAVFVVSLSAITDKDKKNE